MESPEHNEVMRLTGTLRAMALAIEALIDQAPDPHALRTRIAAAGELETAQALGSALTEPWIDGLRTGLSWLNVATEPR